MRFALFLVTLSAVGCAKSSPPASMHDSFSAASAVQSLNCLSAVGDKCITTPNMSDRLPIQAVGPIDPSEGGVDPR